MRAEITTADGAVFERKLSLLSRAPRREYLEGGGGDSLSIVRMNSQSQLLKVSIERDMPSLLLNHLDVAKRSYLENSD